MSASVIDSYILDLYAGTGNLGIEALSRGAKFAVFVDRDRECAKIIRENLEHTKLESRGEVITGQAISAIKRLKDENKKFDIVFMDPPYKAGVLEDTIAEVAKSGILNIEGIIVAEHDIRHELLEEINGFSLKDSRKYGDTAITFYTMGR